MQPVNDAGAERMFSHWLLEELMIPADFGTRDIVAQAIRLESKQRGGMEQAAKFILQQARAAKHSGERINRFWFSDQRYLSTNGLLRSEGLQTPEVSEEHAREMREYFERKASRK